MFDVGFWIPAVETGVSALATVALFFVGACALRQNQKLVKQNAEQLKVLQDQTAALREQISVLAAGVKPHLEVTWNPAPRAPVHLSVFNRGLGPALWCCAAVRVDEQGGATGQAQASKFFVLQSGDKNINVPLEDALATQAMQILELPTITAACICRDELGNCYRFVPGVPSVDSYAAGSNEPAPPWTQPFGLLDRQRIVPQTARL